ncbi:MAG: WYL domain-containing protein [Muribaculaceae bacterium]|nr:WYL domain-containing protein [Muribaculaceae bacterium]
MTQTEKYIWLIDTIYKAKKISLEDISQQWRDYAGLNADEKLHRATFNRWKDEIFSQFGIMISCKRAGGYKYYIENPEVIEENKLNKWMLDTIATGNLINSNISISDRILVNKIPSGNDHLKSIIDALKNNARIEITYQQFDLDSHTFAINPYCLKLFENRWYVLGKNNWGQIKIYCLDRILKIKMLDARFAMPKNFDAERFFAPFFGVVIADDETKPTKIVLRAYDVHRHYIASLPLHDSQRLIEDTGEYADFELYVAPTYDLVMKLLSFGATIEVIKPVSLRNTMRGWVSELYEMYSNRLS